MREICEGEARDVEERRPDEGDPPTSRSQRHKTLKDRGRRKKKKKQTRGKV